MRGSHRVEDPRNGGKAGANTPLISRGIAALARLRDWTFAALFAGTVLWRDRRPQAQSEGAGREVDVIIERRALMLYNRNRTAAQAYIDRHAILSRGRA